MAKSGGGSLTVNGDASLGTGTSVSLGTINQTGGSINVTGDVLNGPGTSTVRVDNGNLNVGGDLKVDTLRVGYLPSGVSISKMSLLIALMDTLVALLAGLVPVILLGITVLYVLLLLVIFPRTYLENDNLGILYDLYLQQPAAALNHYRTYLELSPQPDNEVRDWVVDLERRVTSAQAKAVR